MISEPDGCWNVHCPEARWGHNYRRRLGGDGQEHLREDPRAGVIDPATGDGMIYQDYFDWGIEAREWQKSIRS